MTSPRLTSFVTRQTLATHIAAARAEDLGASQRDITSDLLIDPSLKTRAVMRARQPGRLAGAALLKLIAHAYDPAIRVKPHTDDGSQLKRGSDVASFTGPLKSILAMERVALNYCNHLSGIATLTAEYVNAVAGTNAGIYDTRKTTPGMRGLEKYAVVCGGGHSHRIGLYDAVLIKDNHIAHIPLAELAAHLSSLVKQAREARPKPTFIEVEVDRLDQLAEVLKAPVDIVLLDNMKPQELRKAVAMRNATAGDVELEASGGVNLRTVRRIAETGVDRIAIGALTHSAPTLDLGLDIDA
jgi:nicotinate-nucleotide pyrophosphorylase (carboxylating)